MGIINKQLQYIPNIILTEITMSTITGTGRNYYSGIYSCRMTKTYSTKSSVSPN